ncbi:MAG: hypothetical protein P0120_13590 [Nitrospira sp.]|nr:hypothetical protein [Nitrospira sp.]
MAFRVLAANQRPDFRTLSDFRKQHLTALADLFVQVLKLCQRAIRDPGLKQATHFEKLDEERQLAKWSHSCSRVPLDVDSPPKRLERNRPLLSGHGLAWCLTHWVTPFVRNNVPPLRCQQAYPGAGRCFNCRL